MIENGDLQCPLLKLTPELAFRFSQFGTIVAHRRTQRMDIRLPFYHLSSDGVWSAFTKDGTESLDPKATQFVKINEEFFSLSQSADFRSMARGVLIRSYFEPTEQVALASLVNLSIADLASTRSTVCESETSYQCGRAVRFRLDIVAAYNYTCALTGYRLQRLAERRLSMRRTSTSFLSPATTIRKTASRSARTPLDVRPRSMVARR